ncbi:MAG: glycosyltransferase family 2 protein [Thermotogae bacterium]|nr:glycosyltransferase family 2 protein [Thermotogota bacterium]
MLKVSIVIPAYNEEKSIERTLKSLLKQTYPEYEVVVVNNNSKDRTKEIAQKYVRVIDEYKQGYMFAVRRGIEETDGEVITICDADSIYPGHWIERMVKPLGCKGTVATYGTSGFYDTGFFMRIFSLVVYTVFLWISKLFGLDNTAGFNFVFLRKAYEEVGGYDLNWRWGSPDIELGNRLKKVGKVKLVHTIVKTSSRRFRKGGFGKTAKMFLHLWWQMVKHKRPDISYEDYNKTRR